MGKIRRWSAIFAMVVVTTLAMAPVVSADSIVDFKCVSHAWLGSVFPTTWGIEDRTTGTVRQCFTVTKRTGNASYDFYELRIEDEWTTTWDGGWPHNHGIAIVSSTVQAYNGTDFKATPTVVGDPNCFNAVAFSYTFFGFGISVRPELCDKAVVSRYSMDHGGARWESEDVRRTPVWDEVYFIKIAHGKHSLFQSVLYYPKYVITRDAQGYFHNTESWGSLLQSIQG